MSRLSRSKGVGSLESETRSICRLCREVFVSHSSEEPDLCADCARIVRMASRQQVKVVM